MMTYTIQITVVVDEEARKEYDPDESPIGQPVKEWYGRDLLDAIEAEVAEVEHSQITIVDEF